MNVRYWTFFLAFFSWWIMTDSTTPSWNFVTRRRKHWTTRRICSRWAYSDSHSFTKLITESAPSARARLRNRNQWIWLHQQRAQDRPSAFHGDGYSIHWSIIPFVFLHAVSPPRLPKTVYEILRWALIQAEHLLHLPRAHYHLCRRKIWRDKRSRRTNPSRLWGKTYRCVANCWRTRNHQEIYFHL